MTTKNLLRELETRLREVWLPGPGEKPKPRACLMNMVVIGTGKVIDQYLPIVDDVTASLPSRAIVVRLEEGAADELTGDVSAVCGIGEGATCSERVLLRAGGGARGRVPSAISALLLPEIRTNLVWLCAETVNDPIFQALASDVDRVVLDTEYTAVASLLALMRKDRDVTFDVVDLAWLRIAPWQELCARFFDPAPLHELAFHVHKVSLRQAGSSGHPLGSEATLLLAWLGATLQWSSQKGNILAGDGTPITLELSGDARDKAVAPLALTHVEISSKHGDRHLRGLIEREHQEGKPADVLMWSLDTNTPSGIPHHVRLGANKGARLLERALRSATGDLTFRKATVFALDYLRSS